MTGMDMVGGASAIAIIMGLVQLSKGLGIKEKYCPLLAVILGLLISLGYHFFNQNTWYEALIVGLVLGLSAVGLYSGTRETAELFNCKQEVKK